MLYLVLFATLAVGFYAATTINTQIARNEKGLQQAQVAADGGMQFIRYQISKSSFALAKPAKQMDVVAAQLGQQLNGTANMNGYTVQNSGGTIYIPAPNQWITIDPTTGARFRAVLTQSGNNLVVTVTGAGTNTTLKRAVQLQFQQNALTGSIFSYGVASKSPITLGGNAAINGATSAGQGSVLIATAASSGLTLSGSPSISGDYSYTNPNLVNSFGSGSIAGYTSASSSFGQHVHSGVAMPNFPYVDPTVYSQYAVNPYVPGSTLLANVTLPPGTYTLSNVNIQGVLYVQSPCNLTIGGKSIIQGVIVTDANPTVGNLTTNVISLSGQVAVKPIGTLPATFPAGELSLTNAFLLAPYYTVNMSGQFGTINGSIIASQMSMSGNASATVQGSIINIADSSMSLSGNAAITIVGNGASSAPAGINYGCNYTVQQGSYLEVTPQ